MVRKRRFAVMAALAMSVGSLTPTMAHAATATTIYVNNAKGSNCSDTGTGAEASPFCTVQAGVDTAVAGDTVLVEPGYYNASVTVTGNGTSSAPITIEAADLPWPLATNQPSEVNSPTSAPAFTVSGASYVTLHGFQAEAAGTVALVENSSHVTIDSFSATTYDNAATTPAIDIAGTSSDVTVSRDYVNSSSSATGIEVEPGSSNDTITTNFLGDFGPGIVVDGASGTAVTSNTVEGDCNQGIALTGASTDATIENNIVDAVETNALNSSCPSSTAPASGIEVDSAATSGTEADYNIDYQPFDTVSTYLWGGTAYQDSADLDAATGQGSHDLNVDPQLAFPGLDTNSPAVDSADSNAPGELSTDMYGQARVDDPNVANTGAGPETYYDRGAFEYIDPLTPAVTMNYQTSTAPATVTADESIATQGWATPGTWTADFGDGSAPTTTSSPSDVPHQYTKPGTYTVTVTATDKYGTATATTTEWVLSSSVFHPVTLTRLLDTRDGTGTGGVKAPLKAQGALSLQIEGNGPIPATGVTAVALNVTATDATGPGFISAYADGSKRPITSNINFGPRETLPAQIIAPVGADGKIELFNGGLVGSTDLVADVAGYFGVGAGLGFNPWGSPTRILDTRNGTGAGGVKAPIPPKSSFTLTSAHAGGLTPGQTLVLNVTVTNAKSSGFLTVYPGGGSSVPSTSNLNFSAGQTVANQVLATVGSDGSIKFYNAGTGSVDVVADLSGAFNTDSGLGYVPISPWRVVDTRNGTGAPQAPVAANATVQATMAGLDGLPTTLQAVTANITVTQPKTIGVLQVYPDYLENPPGTSTLNFGPGETIANSTTMTTENTGLKVLNQSAGSSEVIVDVFGYYSLT
jgi:PKD repeat protein